MWMQETRELTRIHHKGRQLKISKQSSGQVRPIFLEKGRLGDC